jgi:hypothetical protein
MKALYSIYIDNEYHLDYLLYIYYFMLEIKYLKRIVKLLRNEDNVINLNNSISNLKLECETWQ